MRRVVRSVSFLVVATCAPATAWASAETCAASAEHAQDLRDTGKLVESLALFEGCAAEACPRVVREDCRKALFDLREKTPRIVLHVTAGGVDVSDASIAIDGAAVSEDERTHGKMVDPGTHHVTVSKQPLPPVEATVVISLSDGIRRVDVPLQPVQTVTPTTTTTTTVVIEHGKPSHTASFVFGGVGLALLAGFGAIGTWTYVDYRQLSSTCSPGCGDDVVSPLRTQALVADVMLGVGVVSLVVATILWIATPSRKTTTMARDGLRVSF